MSGCASRVSKESGAPPLVGPLFRIATCGRSAASTRRHVGVVVPVMRNQIDRGFPEKVDRTHHLAQCVPAQIPQVDEAERSELQPQANRTKILRSILDVIFERRTRRIRLPAARQRCRQQHPGRADDIGVDAFQRQAVARLPAGGVGSHRGPVRKRETRWSPCDRSRAARRSRRIPDRNLRCELGTPPT